MSSRGIVTSAGGSLYFLNAYLNIWLLRQKGCTLPVHWAYLGKEMTPAMLAAAGELSDVTLIDLGENNPDNSKAQGGWQSKAEAICASSFDEVLWIDADSFATRDPSFLFESPQYQETGCVLWPDPFSWGDRLPMIRERFGVPNLPDRQIESGQMLFDKRRCEAGLLEARAINRDWKNTYRYLFGDKDSFPIGMHQAGCSYAVPPIFDWHLHGGMLQRDFDGRVLFAHLVQGKFEWHGIPRVKENVLPGVNGAVAKIAELRKRIFGEVVSDTGNLRPSRGAMRHLPPEKIPEGFDPQQEKRRMQQGGCCSPPPKD